MRCGRSSEWGGPELCCRTHEKDKSRKSVMGRSAGVGERSGYAAAPHGAANRTNVTPFLKG